MPQTRLERADLLHLEEPLFGLTVSHLAQWCELRDENTRFKRMYTDLALMHSALKDGVGRKTLQANETMHGFAHPEAIFRMNERILTSRRRA